MHRPGMVVSLSVLHGNTPNDTIGEDYLVLNRTTSPSAARLLQSSDIRGLVRKMSDKS